MSIRRAGRLVVATFTLSAALVAGGAVPAQLVAQQAQPSQRSIDAAKPLFRRGDAVFIGGALVTIALTTLVDQHLAVAAQQPGGPRDRFHRLTALGSTVGDAYPVELVLGLWATGFVARKGELETLGREGAEALLISGVVTQLIKGTVGRERPSSATGHADNYEFGRGFGNNAFSSFPSGHTSVAFSVATVMAVGTAHKSPLLHNTISVIAFGVATSVGLSRLYDNDHWASDVLGGAAVGITSGLVAIRIDHRLGGRPRRASVGTLFDHLTVAPAPRGGIALGYSSR
jgi:membrane-associated phospholipid phosphatase